MSELKPCPFCGGDDVSLLTDAVQLFGYRFPFAVMCHDCGAYGAAQRTERLAIEAWNDRAERTCQNVHIEAENCNFFQCSECGCEITDFEGYHICFKGGGWNYCPNCGAKVVVE